MSSTNDEQFRLDVHHRLESLLRLGEALATSIQAARISTDSISDEFDTLKTRFQELEGLIRTQSQGDATIIPLTATAAEQSVGEDDVSQTSPDLSAGTVSQEPLSDPSRGWPDDPVQFAPTAGWPQRLRPQGQLTMALRRTPQISVRPNTLVMDTISTALTMPTPPIGIRTTGRASRSLCGAYVEDFWDNGERFSVEAISRGSIEWTVRITGAQ